MGPPPMPPSLSAHPDVLWIVILCLFAILSGLLHGVGVVFLKMGMKILDRIERKQDAFFAEQSACREELPQKYLTLKAFEDWGEGRDDLWNAINNHRHAEDGGVIRSNTFKGKG
jgi:hypothetical protein